jgi:hypothetical protein
MGTLRELLDLCVRVLRWLIVGAIAAGCASAIAADCVTPAGGGSKLVTLRGSPSDASAAKGSLARGPRWPVKFPHPWPLQIPPPR